MTTLLIILAIVATATVVAWFIFQRQNPERAASHLDVGPDTTSDQLYRGARRPAGPDAEPMGPERLGGDQRPPSS